MRPHACFTTFLRSAVELTDEREQIFWAGLKHFLCDFRSGFTIVYGEKYAFLSLFTKVSWTNGRTNGRTDTASCRDVRTHLKSVGLEDSFLHFHVFFPFLLSFPFLLLLLSFRSSYLSAPIFWAPIFAHLLSNRSSYRPDPPIFPYFLLLSFRSHLSAPIFPLLPSFHSYLFAPPI